MKPKMLPSIDAATDVYHREHARDLIVAMAAMYANHILMGSRTSRIRSGKAGDQPGIKGSHSHGRK